MGSRDKWQGGKEGQLRGKGASGGERVKVAEGEGVGATGRLGSPGKGPSTSVRDVNAGVEGRLFETLVFRKPGKLSHETVCVKGSRNGTVTVMGSQQTESRGGKWIRGAANTEPERRHGSGG